jgi:hypothetical protein
MIKRLAVVTLLLGLLCFTMVGATFAQTVSPGVSQGNTFTYDVKAFWSSTDANVTVPDSAVQTNMTDWYRVTITGVSGADISLTTTWHFTNGTEVPANGSVNVETGMYQGPFWTIIAGNLNQGDRIHPTGPDQVTINSTANRDYSSGGRSTNHLSLQFQYYDTNDPTHTYTEYTNTYFDQQTGMLVELDDQQVYSNPSQTVTITWKIQDSNVWTVPEFPTWLILPLFMIVTLSAAIAYKKKRGSIGINSVQTF